ncbi:CAAX protease self-immunity [Mucilaginibacter sp. OK268]|jgi:membrane protease YdiL (CAAX protease family)|uniref:CPBP family intramembrane glutamic endopeptidase n=1 Tax=Mucilaginibacter sp. OK268 TaxID=1881048 RepID=UPI000890D628|nr:CPBP family intramembrane glutamic endopeptidase [Mucilaginibacter sp. OK268]SDP86250.1 CAAX protease self-immunity [Mucilaginibacter sp. OK268]
MIIISLIGAIVQLLVFAFLPFLVYLLINKTVKGFFGYTGIHKTTYPAITLAVLSGFILGSIGIAVMYASPVIRQIAAGKGTVPEQIRLLTSRANRILLILIVAFIKTALAEEIFFRGFIAKRLITWLGYKTGNIIQAFIFGAMHVLLFLSIPGMTPAFLSFAFLLPGTSGYLACYLNEKKGKGSIYPGWIIHGIGNLISYIFLVFITG